MTRYIRTAVAATLCVIATLFTPDLAAQKAEFAVKVCGYTAGNTVATVPASVKSIPEMAFADCSSLKEIRFAPGARVASIGANAFLGCKALERIALPSSVLTLGEGCFRECAALKKLVIPAGVKKLPRFMCEWDEALEEVILPAGLKDIGSHAFAYCSSLKKISIPSGVTHIGSNVFSFCTSLREMEIPDSVKELESYAFSECTSLERVKLPANPSMLGELIFSGCRSLELIREPSTVPPTFDCNSFLFEPDEAWLYDECSLEVPVGSVNAYREAHGWNLIKKFATAKATNTVNVTGRNS